MINNKELHKRLRRLESIAKVIQEEATDLRNSLPPVQEEGSRKGRKEAALLEAEILNVVHKRKHFLIKNRKHVS